MKNQVGIEAGKGYLCKKTEIKDGSNTLLYF